MKQFVKLSFPFSVTSLIIANYFCTRLRDMGIYSFVVRKTTCICVVCPNVLKDDKEKLNHLYYSLYGNEHCNRSLDL